MLERQDIKSAPVKQGLASRQDSRSTARFARLLVDKVLILLVLVAAWSVAPNFLDAQQPQGVINREFLLKAAYLYNFANYVEWPAGAFPTPDAPFTIGVLGSDPFGAALDELQSSKKVRERRILIKRFSKADQVQPCQLLYIEPNVSKAQRAETLKKLAHVPVLIVTDSSEDSVAGGVINFVTESNRIRFTVDTGLAKQHDLKVSSKILALAKRVTNN